MSKRATREALGATLVELAREGADIFAVDADLARATTLQVFGNAYPDRLLNVGIAEQDMMGVAAGIALTGATVFTGSFAAFGTGRCYDQIRNTVCESRLNVKVCPTHAGITVGEDGATHQMLEDIGLMRGLPGMRVLVPADYHAACAAIRLAADIEGPVYIRFSRFATAEVYDGPVQGRLPWASVLREGADVSLLACGVEVEQALLAAELLAAEGVSAEVIDIESVTPLDEELICRSASKTGHVVTAEDHCVATGMGAAVAGLLAERCPTPMRFVGMWSFGTSASADVLLKHFGLDAEGIKAAAFELLR
ncbi:transketolase family protein [Enorma phocaeensis]|uniref:Transketolase family protein n=1 Tax=Enorma phocaeensis TaxID=1871019 RepID=A0A921IX52_9ACTN|nr:transketolase C-terminal domain-containing protein [Enorma phocaeensis]HJG37635.1 transketolase family protein [Enorma phocaeensis]